ncbi:M23 family metallopeptidase [Sphingomonas lycopersici]|uniref:M23 family metallopeptidase n=1 Tax=Sphingomonas lycopersici TaxID=2951807 RepID=A0AA41Z6R6_9SPHN|nr:M23 family metallopeptidase [Sphingomonas lycopersici]MCW6533864.1 M23 family metallopeptidase [Sphingomonas lycopersici]
MEPAKRKRLIASTAAGLWLLLAGAGAAHAQDAAAAVHIGRAVDLAGTPVALFRPKPPPAALFGKFAAPGPVAMPAGMPVAARALTSGFGARFHPLLNERRAHLGIDLAAATGSPIVATSPGVVSAQGWYGGYGDLVVINHGGGVETRYGHMSRSNVVAGQHVQRGDVIGYVGSTGLSTGPHLHYEVRIGGQPVDPIRTLAR